MPDAVFGVEQHAGGEAAALLDLVRSSSEWPEWQRDALRRICIHGSLSDEDAEHLLAICRGECEAEPLSIEHVRDPTHGSGAVTLRQLRDLRNVNALAVGEKLSFGKAGLTVVYGDNGAGKSGYARVLKQACRARMGRRAEILPDISAIDPGVPSGTIDYLVGAQGHTAAWTYGAASDPALSAVSVFDSQTATLHVDGSNDLAYTPRPLKVLAALADACRELQRRVGDETRRLEEQTPEVLKTPACSGTTAVGQLVQNFSGNSDPEQFRRLSKLSAEETRRFETLQLDLGLDPTVARRNVGGLAARLQKIVDRFGEIEAAIGDECVENLHHLSRKLAAADQAAAAASTRLFSDEPLPDIGGDAWRQLWDAARSYSRVSAYKDRQFPVTSPGARCVLCQQEIGEAAARRLSSFEAFVRDESARQRQAAQTAYNVAREKVRQARPQMSGIPTWTAVLRDELRDPELARQFRQASLLAAWRARAILRGCLTIDALPNSPAFPSAAFSSAIGSLRSRAETLAADASSPERAKLIAERDGLADRKWLGVVLDDVLAHIKRLKAVAELKTIAGATKTKPISDKSTEIARSLVTDRLRAQFARELDKLGVGRLAVELQQVGSAVGVPHFRVRLLAKPATMVGTVLSEGEHRCVALAAFLAELSTIDARSAIVFDDPISSLDHVHRERVAARLAEEAQRRQVIVFTHDLAFLLLLDEACRFRADHPPINVLYRLICRGEDAAGYCTDEPPSDVVPIGEVTAQMRRHLANVKILYARGEQAKWVKEVKYYQVELRTAWERAVEEVVRPVLKRLHRKVNTDGLLKLTVLTREDHATMRSSFERCSMLLHSQPGELRSSPCSPADIEAEIVALEEWLTDIRLRQDRQR